MKTVDAAKAGEHFARFLNQVHSFHESFEIVKQGIPYAYLIPPADRGCNSHELADDLADADLTKEDRRALATAVSNGRKAIKPLRNPWG